MMSLASLDDISRARPINTTRLIRAPEQNNISKAMYDSNIIYPPPPPQTVPQLTTLPKTGGGKVELGVEEYLKLLQMEQFQPILPPQNYFISKATYVGSSKENYIHMNVTLEVAVLVNTWNKIKLLPDAVGLSSHSIKSLSAPSDESPRIGVMEGGYFLITQGQGELVVSLSVFIPYSSARRSGTSLWVPRAAENHITFTVAAKDVEIKVDPSFVGDDSDEFSEVKDKELPKDKYETVVSILFPPTNLLNINWTVKIDEGPSVTKAKEIKKIQKMMITAEHSTMCSIGEGVVLMTSLFNYSIVHGSASTFEIAIPDDFNLLGVEGNGIKKWEVVGGKEEKTKDAGGQRCLRVILDYGLEDAYRMTVISELAMAGTSADVSIPSFRCIGEEINREKGFLAVEARTNVEIAELKRECLALVDTSELPQNLTQLAGNPILMGYKFLQSGYLLDLRVKKHDDVGVLVAACDEAHYIATCSEEGKILHKMILQIRNSQKQYVRVKIPTAHELWSATVAGQPVKPAMDEEGMVMVQLQKSSAKNSGNNVFVVEIVYIEQEDKPMASTGTLGLRFAQLDIPINYLFVSVNLPTDFYYKDFTGSLREVQHFTKSPPRSPTSSTHNNNDDDLFQSLNTNVQYSRRSSISMNFSSMPNKREERRLDTKGVLPVKVEMPVSGKEFRFEQLIVMGGELVVSTEYKKHKKTNVRKNRSCC